MSYKPRYPVQRKNRAPQSHSWMLTFADLMSLLMGFFVILLAASEIDNEKFSQMHKSVQNSLYHYKPQKLIPTTTSDFDSEKIDSYHQQFVAKANNVSVELKKYLAEQNLNSDMEISVADTAVVIRIGKSAGFSEGGVQFGTTFKLFLDKLRTILKKSPGTIVVAGYTDNKPIQNSFFRSNWELSASRAYSVIEALSNNNEIDEERFLLRGYGPTHPLVPNDSDANRSKNRRIEIILEQEN